MANKCSLITLSQHKLSEQMIDNYMIGHELEILVREVLQKDFNIACKSHFVTEPGPDAKFRNGAVEMINCKPYLTVSETRLRRILQNLKQKRIKIVIASYAQIFTKKQTMLLRQRGIRIIEIGTQILPEYLWNAKPPEKRLGTKKSSRRNLKWAKNRILSQLLKIKELLLIYYYQKGMTAIKVRTRELVISLCATLENVLKASAITISKRISQKWKYKGSRYRARAIICCKGCRFSDHNSYVRAPGSNQSSPHSALRKDIRLQNDVGEEQSEHGHVKTEE